MLFSLGACQEITTKAFANAMGVPLTRVSVQLKGHIDLRGFFAVDDSVRAGFNKILGLVFFFCCTFFGQGAKRPGEKIDMFKVQNAFWSSKPLEVCSKKVEVGKCWNLKTPNSKALGFFGAQIWGLLLESYGPESFLEIW